MRLTLKLATLVFFAVPFLLVGCHTVDTKPGINVTIEAEPAIGAAPLQVTFKALLPDYAGQVSDLAYTWDFGDGSEPSTEAAPAHTYAEEGTFTVQLTVSDETASGKAKLDVEVGPIGPGVDLRVDTIDVTPSTINPGGQVTIKGSVTNAGSDAATGVFMVRLYVLQSEEFPTSAPPSAVGVINVQGIQGGETLEVSGSAYVPSGALPGPYYVFAYVDGPEPNSVVETNEDNNVTRSQLPLTVTDGTLPVDISVDSLTSDLSGVASPGDSFTVTAVLRNNGTQDAGTFKVAFRLSVDPIIEVSSGDQPLGGLINVPSVAAGGTESVQQTFMIPAALDDRPYYLGVVADPNGDLAETDESNNVGVATDLIRVGGTGNCVEDAYEPNETPDTAVLLAEGNHTSLNVCPASVDWYDVSLAAGDRLTAQIDFNNADGNLDLALYDPADLTTPLMTSNGSGNTELIQSALVTQATTYKLKVTLSSSAMGSAYDMGLALLHSGGNGKDLVPANAALSQNPIDAGGTLMVTYDVYNFGDTDVAVSSATELWLSTDTALDGADTLLGSDMVGAVMAGDHASVSISATIPQTIMPGNYYLFLVVDAADAITETYEDNNRGLEPIAIGIGCIDDTFEPNDSLGGAGSLSTGTMPLHLCDGNDDYFAVEVQDGATLDATITFVHADGDIDFALLNMGGSTLDTSAGTSNTENVSYMNTSGSVQTYVLRVYYYSGTSPVDEGSAYTLDISGAIATTVDLSPVSVSFSPDVAQEGDGVEVTFQIANISAEDAGAFDVDIRLSQDDTIDGADMVVDTVSSAGLLSGASQMFTKKFTVPAAAVGASWRVGVFADAGGALTEASETNNGRASSGTLTILNPCADDMFEDNDSPGAAANINVGDAFPGLQVCAGDEDWFTFVAGANQDHTFRIDFTNASGDLDLKVYQADGVTLIGSSVSGVNDFEEVTWPATNGTAYKVVVKGFQNAANAYDLAITQN